MILIEIKKPHNIGINLRHWSFDGLFSHNHLFHVINIVIQLTMNLKIFKFLG
jgi:hypothetical protein